MCAPSTGAVRRGGATKTGCVQRDTYRIRYQIDNAQGRWQPLESGTSETCTGRTESTPEARPFRKLVSSPAGGGAGSRLVVPRGGLLMSDSTTREAHESAEDRTHVILTRKRSSRR